MKTCLGSTGFKPFKCSWNEPQVCMQCWLIREAISVCVAGDAKEFNTLRSHDDVIKWKHFPRYWPFVRGIQRPPVNSPHKGQRREALMFSWICVWMRLNKRLRKQSWGWWFETLSCPLWRHCNADKIVAILLTNFSNTFSWMRIVIFWFKFRWFIHRGTTNNTSTLV